MKNEKYTEALNGCDVPEMLDRRILAAAQQKAAHFRRRNIFLYRFMPAAGIAAAFAVCCTVLFFQNHTEVRHQEYSAELLAMNDWTELEQLSYNLDFELDNSMIALADISF